MAQKGLLLALALAVASAAVLAYRLAGNGNEAAQRVATSEGGDAPTRASITIDGRRRQLLGVRTATVERRRSVDVRAPGIVTFDETREVDINTKVDGWVRDLKANATGMTVQKGDVLFTLHSPDLLDAETAFVDALRERAHAADLTASTPSPMSNILMTPDEAREHVERMIEAARTRLLLLDFTVPEVRELERRGRGLGVITFLAPASGTIVEKAVVEGMRASAGQRLFRLADLSSVWIEADVLERDLSSVRTGQTATVTLQAYPGDTFRGRIAYIYPALTAQSRTAKVRLTLANPGGRLKPGMFATVSIEGPARMALTVPIDALVDSGREQIVFVAEGDGYFEPRSVVAGERFGDGIEIREGLEEGQLVAAAGTFFLDSESQMRGALQNYAKPPASAETMAGKPAASSLPGTGERLQITFRAVPDPPRTGDATFEVRVTAADGRAVRDAQVSALLFMPAMPSMNMPAMRSDVELPPAGDGTYRGTGRVTMAGRWDVTVTVSRDGRPLGSRQLALLVR